MPKEELSIASPEPVALGDTAASTSQAEPAAATKEEKAPEPEEEPPSAPPRPVSPVTAMKNELRAAFPSVQDRLVTAVLVASQGNMENAFNALLYISDESMEEPPILAARSKPAAAPVEDDEALARRLQKQFEAEERRRRKTRRSGEERRRRSNDHGDESPDDFDQIKETFNQGLEEARTTLNGWVSGIAKKFGDSKDERPKVPPKQNPKLFGALGGSSFNSRRNSKFDEDPEILSNDFHQKINLQDNDDAGPQLPKRKASEEEKKNWQPLNSDAPVNSDAFLVTDSEEEDKKEPETK